jgi:predicted phage terminase large subunit-like protein
MVALLNHPMLTRDDPWTAVRKDTLGRMLQLRQQALEKPETFREYVTRVSPKFKWYDHCIRLADVLQRVADGELLRVIIMAPPRHGKSEQLSRLFSAYYLSRYPERFVALTSYAAELAYTLSRAARDNYVQGGGVLKGDAAAVKHWETAQGGGLWAAGFGGPATGKGFHLGLIDDPIKNAQEAASDVIGGRNQEWYRSVFYTRPEPDAAIVVMQTRWPGPGDLIGWLFEQEVEGDEPERWHVVSFEALKDEQPPEIPATCTLEPDPRAPGDALCPERYPADRLKKIRARIGSFFFNALFQQRPSPREGAMFKWGWWLIAKTTPVVHKLRRYWDLAGTEPKRKGHDPDYTASTLAGAMHDQRTTILDVTDFRESVGKRDTKIEEIAREDRSKYGVLVEWWFEQEAGIGGEERMTSLVRRIQALGLTVHVEPATGSKLLRAEPLAAAAEAGNVVLGPDNAARPWHDRFRTHMSDFSATCAHDDIADSASGAFNKITEPGSVWGSSTYSR